MSDNIHVCSELVPIDATESRHMITLLQFWRGEQEFLRPYPLHWALYVETGPDVGNTYEIVGDQNTYTFCKTENQPLEDKNDCRGGCYVGRLNSEAELAIVGDILEKVEIFQNNPVWNSHNWVEAALRTLGNSGFCIYRKESSVFYGRLQDIMLYELECWLGVAPHGHSVEFVGHECLKCVTHSRFRRLDRRAGIERREPFKWRVKD